MAQRSGVEQDELSKKANSAAAAIMADLGFDRRERIITTDRRHYAEAGEEQLEKLRASNIKGTKEYKIAQKNKSSLNAWSNLWQQNEDLDLEEGEIPEVNTGQTHRLRVRQELHGQQPGRGSGPQLRSHMAQGHLEMGQIEAGGRSRGNRTRELPKLTGPPPNPSRGTRTKELPKLTGPPTMLGRHPIISAPLRPVVKRESKDKKPLEPEPWPIFAKIPTKARAKPQNVQSPVEKERNAAMRSSRDVNYVGELATGTKFVSTVNSMFSSQQGKQPNAALNSGANRPTVNIEPQRINQDVLKIDDSMDVDKPHPKKHPQPKQHASGKTKVAGVHTSSPDKVVDKPEKGQTPHTAKPDIQAKFVKLTGPTAAAVSEVAGLPIVDDNGFKAKPDPIASAAVPTAKGPSTTDIVEDTEVDTVKATKKKMMQALYGLQALLELSQNSDSIRSMIHEVQKEITEVDKRLYTMERGPHSPSSATAAVLPRDTLKQSAKAVVNEVTLDTNPTLPKDVIEAPTRDILTIPLKLEEKPSLLQLGIIGDLADSIHRDLANRFHFEADPIPDEPRVGPHNLPGRYLPVPKKANDQETMVHDPKAESEATKLLSGLSIEDQEVPSGHYSMSELLKIRGKASAYRDDDLKSITGLKGPKNFLIAKSGNTTFEVCTMFQKTGLIRVERLEPGEFVVEYSNEANAKAALKEAHFGHVRMLDPFRNIPSLQHVDRYKEGQDTPRSVYASKELEGFPRKWLIRGVERIGDLVKVIPPGFSKAINSIESLSSEAWIIGFENSEDATLAMKTIPSRFLQAQPGAEVHYPLITWLSWTPHVEETLARIEKRAYDDPEEHFPSKRMNVAPPQSGQNIQGSTQTSNLEPSEGPTVPTTLTEPYPENKASSVASTSTNQKKATPTKKSVATRVLGGVSRWANDGESSAKPDVADNSASKSSSTSKHPDKDPQWNALFAKYKRPVNHTLPSWLEKENKKKGQDHGEAARRQYGGY